MQALRLLGTDPHAENLWRTTDTLERLLRLGFPVRLYSPSSVTSAIACLQGKQASPSSVQ